MHDLYNFITNYRGIYHVDTKYIKIFMIYTVFINLFILYDYNVQYVSVYIWKLSCILSSSFCYLLYIHTYTCIYNLHEAKLLFWNIFTKNLFINWFLKYKLSILIIWRRSCITIHYLLMSSWHILAKTRRDIFFLTRR